MHQQFRILFVTAILIQLVLGTRAQSPSGLIRGAVRDSATHDPLESATVTLFAIKPGKNPGLLSTRRNTNGGFVFRGLWPGNYRLIATYLGYLPDTVEMTLKTVDSTGPFLTMDLRRNRKDLMQVVVTAHIPPAIVHNDTIAFNASAYPTRANATVEDLLRKLPGFDIDKDGNVTMQGQRVDKIYLDGKEFFLNDPRMATQNLPADIVEQIETFDSRTDRARLTGIKDFTHTKTINIKLKKSSRRSYFGDAYAGAGTGGAADPGSPASAYSAGGTATSLGKSWLFGRGNINNINNQFTGEENRNGPGSGGVQRFNNLQLNYSSNKDYAQVQQPTDQPPTKTGPLTFTLNAGTSGNRTVLNQATSTLTSLADSSLLSNRTSRSINTSQGTNFYTYDEYKIDSFSQLNLYSGITTNNSSGNETDTTAVSTQRHGAAYPDNQGKTVNGSHTNDLKISNSIDYAWRGKLPGRTLFVNLLQSHDHQDQPLTTYSLVNNLDSLGNLLSQTLVNQSIAQTTVTDGYSGWLAYTEPLRPGHVLDLSYRVNQTITRSDRQANDFDSATKHYDRPDSGTSNHFTTHNTTQLISTGYNAMAGKVQYQIGLTLQLSRLANVNRTNDSTLILRQVNWYPRFSLMYNPGQGKNLMFFYNESTTSPTIAQLQPVADPTNPFLVKIGNPGLIQQLTHSVNVMYNSLNTHTFQNWQLGMQGSYSEHAITTSTTVLAGGIQQVEYINVNGVWNSSAELTYGFPLGDQRKGNSSISLRGSYGRGVTGVNGALDVTGTSGYGATWKVNLHPTDQLFVESQAAVNYTGNHYSLNTGQNTSTWLQTYSLDVSYTLPGAVTLSSFCNLQVTGAQGNLPAQTVSVWNASVYKDLGRSHHAQLRLSALGLLNETHNVTQTVGAGYTSTAQTNMPGRVLLLSFVYHFHHFQPGAKGAQP